LLRAYLKQGLFRAKNVTATVKHGEKATAIAKELGVAVSNDNRAAVKGADIVLLGVKPQVIAEVLKAIAPEVSEKTLIISGGGFGADQLSGAASRRGERRKENAPDKSSSDSRDAEYSCCGGLRNDWNLPRSERRGRAPGNCEGDV